MNIEDVKKLPGWPQTVETWLHLDDVKWPIETFVNADPECHASRRIAVHVYSVNPHVVKVNGETKTVYRQSTCMWFQGETYASTMHRAKVFLSKERMKLLKHEMGTEKRRVGRMESAENG